MSSEQELQLLITRPREDLSREYKNWLDLSDNSDKAVLAKAAIALANHGGGFIVIGFNEDGGSLVSLQRPTEIREITQDAVNSAVKRYSSPSFHCQLHNVNHPETGVGHSVIVVPGNLTVPVMSKRSHPGTIDQHRCYMRKPGPESEEPKMEEEWRKLLDRCVREGRNELLDAIRSIVHGHVEPGRSSSDPLDDLEKFCEAGRERWNELTETGPALARFPHGYYEMGFSFVGAQPLNGLSELKSALGKAGRIELTVWPPFFAKDWNGYKPYPHDNHIESWIGIETDVREHGFDIFDFWRASPAGELYTIRSYFEDGMEKTNPPVPAGETVRVDFPIWIVGEALLFAERFAATFEKIDKIYVYLHFTGLKAHKLDSRKLERDSLVRGPSMTDEVVCRSQATQEQVRNNLVEILHELLAPLYEKFDFYKLEPRLVHKEIERMRTGKS